MPTPHDPNATSDLDTDGLHVMLAAPSHDELTRYTSGLLRGLSALGFPGRLRVFESPLTYAQMLADDDIDPVATEVALVFCGHGEDDSLRGPGADPGAPNYETAQASFYDDSQHKLCPRFMLAFCCYAAKGLGRTYEFKTSGQTFVGFDDKIWFVMEGGQYAEWWMKILYEVGRAMLTAPDVYELEKAALNVYKDALWEFRIDNDGQNDWGFLMRSYLRRQARALNFIQT